MKLGREGLVAQQPVQSWDSVSSSGVPVLKCSGNDACSELWVIVEYCDRGTLGVRLASRDRACEGEAAWVHSPGAGIMNLLYIIFLCMLRSAPFFPCCEAPGPQRKEMCHCCSSHITSLG